MSARRGLIALGTLVAVALSSTALSLVARHGTPSFTLFCAVSPLVAAATLAYHAAAVIRQNDEQPSDIADRWFLHVLSVHERRRVWLVVERFFWVTLALFAWPTVVATTVAPYTGRMIALETYAVPLIVYVWYVARRAPATIAFGVEHED